jgi:probable DNA repair protein
MLRSGKEVWETPRILPYTAWLLEIDRTAVLFRPDADWSRTRLLTASQEVLTWEAALRSSGASTEMLQPDMLARVLMEANTLCHAWNIDEDDIRRHHNEGSDLFLHVLTEARRSWTTLGVRPTSALPSHIRRVAGEIPEVLPDTLLLAGFDLLPDAAFELMLTALRKLDVHVRFLNPPASRTTTTLLQYPSIENEIAAAAYWCRNLLRNGEQDIAVVLPSLDRLRSSVEYQFSDILDPERVVRGHDAETGLFELSLGLRCAEEPLIAAALSALEVQSHEIPVETICGLLRSPFFGATALQSERRIRLELRIREEGVTTCTAAFLRHVCSRDAEDDVLLSVLSSLEMESEKMGGSAWSASFADFLKRMGWPGDRALSSREYQARTRWEALLDEFASFDTVLSMFTVSEALQRLRRLAQEQVFQPESTGAPVQVMGMLETAGMRFTHCRIIGMNEERWPPPTRANPFIPLQLQRQALVTEIVPERFLEQMSNVTQRAESLAPDMVFSCSNAEKDNELLPSPLLRHLDVQRMEVEERSYAAAMQANYPRDVEDVPYANAPVLTAEETVKGGTRILELQSACPFRAFAEVRLHARTPGSPERGMQMRDRGSTMHRILETFWQVHRTQPALLEMNERDLSREIDALLQQHMVGKGRARGAELPEHLWAAEHACLKQILQEWFSVERAREGFTVRAVEEKRSVRLGELQLDIQIDRIDVVGEEQLLLIDYKSAAHRPGDWIDSRIRDPQLPLYATTGDQPVAGLAYAVLRRGECGFAGLTDESHALPPLQTAADVLRKQKSELQSWGEVVDLWRSGIAALADEFQLGVAPAQPHDGELTCQYCTLRHFCRIDETLQEARDE